jgi:LPXTG-motif cell wall-anchored protein
VKLNGSRVAAFATAGVLAVGALFTIPVVANAQTIETAKEAVVAEDSAVDASAAAVELPSPAISASPTPSEIPVADDDATPTDAPAPADEVQPVAEPAPVDVVQTEAQEAELPAVDLAEIDEQSEIVALALPTTTDVVVSARIAYQRAPVVDIANPAYLAGVTFELFAPGAGGGPGEATGYTCEIPEGALDCTISIPDTATGGANAGDQFYVVMTSAGTDAVPITELMTGTSSEPDVLRYYPGLTSPAAGGETIAFPEPGSGQLTNSLVTAAALDNPALAPSCLTIDDRLSLATQMDLSGSVTETQRNQYRAAFQGVVLSLAGEAVDLSIATFGSSSPVAGRAGGPWALDTEAGVDAALAAIENYTEPVAGATQQTNWDLALRRVAEYDGAFDALLMLTDGAPNYISNNAGTGGQGVSGSEVTLASIEQAVFSANAVKAEGTRVIAMGIGNGVDGPVSRNLAAISGPVAGSDYYQGDWETLSEDLLSVVSPLVCLAPVTATTFVTDAEGETPLATDGFSVSAEVTDVSAGTATVNGDSPQTTGADGNPTGEAVWGVSFSEPDATATLTVSQAAQEDLQLVGSSYTVYHADGTTTTGTGGSPLMILGLERSDRVEVAFVNTPIVAAATFQVRTVVEGPAAASVPGSSTFSVSYTVNGVAGAAPLTTLADGTIVDAPEFEPGDVVVLTQGAQPTVDDVVWGPVPPSQTITLTESSIPLVTFVNTVTAVSPTPATTPTAAPTTVPTLPRGVLPATGSEVAAWPLLAGVGGIMIGVALLLIARRRAARE